MRTVHVNIVDHTCSIVSGLYLWVILRLSMRFGQKQLVMGSIFALVTVWWSRRLSVSKKALRSKLKIVESRLGQSFVQGLLLVVVLGFLECI